MSNLPPYNITFTPSSGTTLSSSDISTTISEYNGFKQARYFFIQLETVTQSMNYAEIEIYDETNTNIGFNIHTSRYIQSSTYQSGGTLYSASNAFDGNLDNFQATKTTSGFREWLGVDLGYDRNIAGIRVYGRKNSNAYYIEGRGQYSRTAPFRIFLYTAAEYTGTFSNGGTGPLNYNNYHLLTNDATTTEVVDNYQQVFYYGIVGQFNNVTEYTGTDTYKSIVNGLPKLFNPSSGTSLSSSNVNTTLSGYTGNFTAIMGTNVQYILANAFENRNVTDISFANVESINDEAFKGCTKLTSVTIPKTVSTIEWKIFENCTNLATAKIPLSYTNSNNTYFGVSYSTPFYSGSGIAYRNIFKGCTNLDVTIVGTGSMNNIGGNTDTDVITNATYSSANITIKYEIPDDVTSIGAEAFISDQVIKGVTIPESVTSIGIQAFYGASNMTSCTFTGTSNLATLGNQCFYASGLTSIEIPDSVTEIGYSSLGDCDSLTSCTFTANSSLVTIGERGFFGSSGLTSIAIPNSVTSIGIYAFYGCSGLTSCTLPINASFTTIPELCFYNSGLTSIAIPDSVTDISLNAFNLTSNMTSCTFTANSNLTTLGNQCFWGSGLTSIAIPDSVTSIGRMAFAVSNVGDSDLTSCTITANSSLVTIGESCFYRSALETINIPKLVTSIGQSAFNQCTSLGDITIHKYPNDDSNNNVIVLDGGSFDSSTKVYTDPQGVFANINNVVIFTIFTDETITISSPQTNAVKYRYHIIGTSIAADAFKDQTDLLSIAIPDSVTTIGDNAFRSCSNLTSCTLPNNTNFTVIPTRCFRQSGLTSIEIPDSVTEIGNEAFYVANNLSSCTLPDNTNFTKINKKAFEQTGLTSITIPTTVTTLVTECFKDTKLTSITIPDSVTTIESGAFQKSLYMTSCFFSLANYQYVFIEATTDTLHLAEIEIFDTANNKISQNGNWTLNSSTGEMTTSNSDAFYFSEMRGTHNSDNESAIHLLDDFITTEVSQTEPKQYGIIGNINADNNGNPRSYQRNCFQNGTETGTDTPYCVLKFNEPKNIGRIVIHCRRTGHYNSDDQHYNSNHNIYLANASDISVATRPTSWSDDTYTTPTIPWISGTNYKSILHSNSVVNWGTTAPESTGGTTYRYDKTYDFSTASLAFTLNTPSNLTTIGASCFKDSGLNSIVIPNSVTSLGASAFEMSDHPDNIYQYVFIETIANIDQLFLSEIEIFDTAGTLISGNGTWIINRTKDDIHQNQMTTSNGDAFYFSESYHNTAPGGYDTWEAHYVVNGNIPSGTGDNNNQGIIGRYNKNRHYQSEIFASGTSGSDTPYCVFKFNEPKHIGKIVVHSARVSSYNNTNHPESSNHNIYLANADSITFTYRPANASTDLKRYATPSIPWISGPNYKSILHSSSGVNWGTTASGTTSNYRYDKTYDFSNLSSFTMSTEGNGGSLSNGPLTSVVFSTNASFTTIPTDCFKNRGYFNHVTIPPNVTTINTGAFAGTTDGYLSLPISLTNYISSSPDNTIFSPNINLLIDYFGRYKFPGSDSLRAQYGTDLTISKYKVDGVDMKFSKGILYDFSYCDYTTTNSTTLDNAFAAYPYAVIGPIGYTVNGIDIGKRIAPYVDTYKYNHSINLRPGWTKLGFYLIGGGGAGGSGGTGAGSHGGGGGAGALAFGYYTRQEISNITGQNISELTLEIGDTGIAGSAGGTPTAGGDTVIKYNSTEIIKAGGGEPAASGTGNTGGDAGTSVFNITNGYNFSIDDSISYSYSLKGQGAYASRSGWVSGRGGYSVNSLNADNPHYNYLGFNFYDSDSTQYGAGGSGSSYGSSAYDGISGYAVVIQYFT